MIEPKNDYTLADTVKSYLEMIRESRSENTARVYGIAMQAFLLVLKEHWIIDDQPIVSLNEDAASWMLSHLKIYSVSTERLYIQAVKGFYQYLAGEKLADINLPRLELLIKKRSRRAGVRFPQFPRDDIEYILEFVNNITNGLSDNPSVRLRAMRDRAFLYTLADTGLRVHEACQLKRGDIDWNEGRGMIIGKGDKQALIRFSTRSLNALKDYLSTRSSLDGASGHPLSSLPLFSRHDKGTGKKVREITTTTGRNIVNEYVILALGKESLGKITPHSFRHYFVTTILRASGNLKLAQELARHTSIQVTQRYAHLSDNELDKGYYEIFEK